MPQSTDVYARRQVKECEKSFLIAIFFLSGCETPVLNVICLLNELYYILGKYVEVICHKATGKKAKPNKTVCISLISSLLKLKRLHFYIKINICQREKVLFFFLFLPVMYACTETCIRVHVLENSDGFFSFLHCVSLQKMPQYLRTLVSAWKLSSL